MSVNNTINTNVVNLSCIALEWTLTQLDQNTSMPLIPKVGDLIDKNGYNILQTNQAEISIYKGRAYSIVLQRDKNIMKFNYEDFSFYVKRNGENLQTSYKTKLNITKNQISFKFIISHEVKLLYAEKDANKDLINFCVCDDKNKSAIISNQIELLAAKYPTNATISQAWVQKRNRKKYLAPVANANASTPSIFPLDKLNLPSFTLSSLTTLPAIANASKTDQTPPVITNYGSFVANSIPISNRTPSSLKPSNTLSSSLVSNANPTHPSLPPELNHQITDLLLKFVLNGQTNASSTLLQTETLLKQMLALNDHAREGLFQIIDLFQSICKTPLKDPTSTVSSEASVDTPAAIDPSNEAHSNVVLATDVLQVIQGLIFKNAMHHPDVSILGFVIEKLLNKILQQNQDNKQILFSILQKFLDSENVDKSKSEGHANLGPLSESKLIDKRKNEDWSNVVPLKKRYREPHI